jgi:hypothetical protein
VSYPIREHVCGFAHCRAAVHSAVGQRLLDRACRPLLFRWSRDRILMRHAITPAGRAAAARPRASTVTRSRLRDPIL